MNVEDEDTKPMREEKGGYRERERERVRLRKGKIQSSLSSSFYSIYLHIVLGQERLRNRSVNHVAYCTEDGFGDRHLQITSHD